MRSFMDFDAIIFIGPQGSGKGTQAKLLKDLLESRGRTVLYVETGGLFRDFVASGDSFAARRTREVVDNGQLMPPFFPIYLWANQLIAGYDGTQDVILDGVARRIEEAPIIASAIEFFKIEKPTVFSIQIADETAVTRLQNLKRPKIGAVIWSWALLPAACLKVCQTRSRALTKIVAPLLG